MKKLIVLLLIVCLALGAAGPQLLAAAAEPASDTHAEALPDPGVLPCEKCGAGTCTVTEQYASRWCISRYDQCIYNPSRQDRTEMRVIVSIYECDSCHLGTFTYQSESRELCFHRQ